MKIFKVKQNHIVRVELKTTKTKIMKSVSFIETDLEQVVKHVDNRCRPLVKFIKEGERISINIRESDPIKRWGKQKNILFYADSIDEVYNEIIRDIEEF